MNDQNKMTVTGAAGATNNAAPGKPQPPLPPLPPVVKLPPPMLPQVGKDGLPTTPPPGWRFDQPLNPATPDQARQWIANHPVDPTKIYKPGRKGGKKANLANNTVQGPASIVELARALKNDAQLIFEWVYNNIEWEPNWGVQKGALGCLISGSGNAFDQSMLLVELLREAGFTANYILGDIQLTEAEYGAWFDTVHMFASYYYLYYANIPATFPSWNGSSYDPPVMSHVWVEVDIGGNMKVLDPSRKYYNRSTSFEVGGTITTSDVCSVTVADAGLSGGFKTINYTVLISDTVNTIAEAMAAAVNADSDLAAIGVTAGSTVAPYPARITLSSRSKKETTYSASVSFGATETLTFVQAASLLPDMLSYNQTTFLADAASGATVTSDYVQNMNTTNIASDLTTMTSNLTSYINGNTVGTASPGTAAVDDIIGGRQIIQVELPFSWLAALGYEAPGMTPTVWTGDVPLGYKTEIQVQYFGFGLNPYTDPADIDETFTSDQLAGTRLTLSYDASLYPVLTLDGTTVATGATAGVVLQPGIIVMTVAHNAYSFTSYPAWHGGIYPGSFYLIGNSWGFEGRGALSLHTKKSLAAQASVSSTDEEKIGEKLACIFASLTAQASRVADIVGRIQRTQTYFYNSCGVVSYFIDPYTSDVTAGTNIGLVSAFSWTLDYDFTAFQPANTAIAMHGVALESAVLAQFNGKKPGVSTTTVVDKANRTANILVGGTVTAGDVLTVAVHDAALGGGVHSVNYTVLMGDTLTSIAAGLVTAINADATLAPLGVVAASASPLVMISSLSENMTSYTSSTSGGATETLSISWEKLYYITSSNWTTGANISATLLANGYTSGDISAISGFLGTGNDNLLVPERPGLTLGDWIGEGYWVMVKYAASGGALGLINSTLKGGSGQVGDGGPQADPDTINITTTQQSTGDPVGTVTGDFSYYKRDISVGSQDFPFLLSFNRSYNSRDQFQTSAMGRGWSHNFNITASFGSDGLLAMGEQFGIPGAPSIAELFVALDLANDGSQPIDKLFTASLSNKWWVDQLVNNTAAVSMPDGVRVFVKAPDGTYIPPAAYPANLAVVFGNFVLTRPSGDQFYFNGDGQISSWVTPSGVTITYTYTLGKLTAVSNGGGRAISIGYTGNLITSVSDGNGRTVSYAYDGSNNLISFTNSLLDSETYVYDQPGRMTQYFLPSNPLTAVVNNIYDSISRIESQSNARSQTTTFYLAGSRSEVVDPVSNSTVYYLNRLGNPVKTIDALGFEYLTDYDGLNRPISKTYPEGNQVVITYDSTNNPLTIVYRPKPGSGLANIQRTFTYDPLWAKPSTCEDGNGNVTTFTYDPVTGNLTNMARPSVGGFTPQIGLTYNARGQILTVTDETNIVTKYTYDSSTEELLSVIQDYGIGGGHLNLTVSFTYDAVGNPISKTDPNSNQELYDFDTERRVVKKTAPTPFGYESKLTYDPNGTVAKIEHQDSLTPTWQTVLMSYSVTDKLLTVQDPSSNTVVWTYDGKDRIDSKTDPLNNTYNYSYDALDRIDVVTDPNSVATDTRTFTNNGLIETRQDANGNITQYSYDGFDRLDTTLYSDTSFEQNTSYDFYGNVVAHVTRGGNTVSSTYDVLNRLETYSPTGQPTVTYEYDLAGRRKKVGTPVVSGDPSSGDFIFHYDSAGRLIQEEYPDGKTVSYDLDANGNTLKVTWPDGYFVDYIFDELDRMTAIRLNGALTDTAAFSYDVLSRRTALNFDNGVSTAFGYQANNGLTSLTHTFTGSSLAFSIGLNGLNRLDSLSVSDSAFMWHPPSASTVSYGTAATNNSYPSVGGQGYTYNADSCLTGDGVSTFSYDTEMRLISVSRSGQNVNVSYDPFSRQVQKEVVTGVTTKKRYIYALMRRIADYNQTTGNLIKRIVYGPGFDEPLFEVDTLGTVSYLHGNHQGSM